MQKLKVIYSCNDKYFDGLYLSILSMIRRTKNKIEFNVLTADFSKYNKSFLSLSKQHMKIIDSLVKSYGSSVNFFDLTKNYFAFFGIKKDNVLIRKYSPYTLLRLLIYQLPNFAGTYLYIDIDTLINGDIKEAFDVDIDGYEIVACHDRNLGKKNNNTYFNAGVMLLNMDEIKKTRLFEKALKYFISEKPLLADQAALNHSILNVKFWKNECRFNYQYPSIKEDTIVKHFLNTSRVKFWTRYIKPWHPNKVKKVLNLHNWDDDYDIYFKEKIKW